MIEKADLIISLDWLDLAGIFRLSLGTAQTQEPADKTIIHCSLDSIRTNGWSMDHQALPAVDIPIFAEPDQFVAQMLDEIGAKKPQRANHAPRLKILLIGMMHRQDPASAGEPMTLWDMAMTVRDFAKKRS